MMISIHLPGPHAKLWPAQSSRLKRVTFEWGLWNTRNCSNAQTESPRTWAGGSSFHFPSTGWGWGETSSLKYPRLSRSQPSALPGQLNSWRTHEKSSFQGTRSVLSEAKLSSDAELSWDSRGLLQEFSTSYANKQKWWHLHQGLTRSNETNQNIFFWFPLLFGSNVWQFLEMWRAQGALCTFSDEHLRCWTSFWQLRKPLLPSLFTTTLALCALALSSRLQVVFLLSGYLPVAVNLNETKSRTRWVVFVELPCYTRPRSIAKYNP